MIKRLFITSSFIISVFLISCKAQKTEDQFDAFFLAENINFCIELTNKSVDCINLEKGNIYIENKYDKLETELELKSENPEFLILFDIDSLRYQMIEKEGEYVSVVIPEDCKLTIVKNKNNADYIISFYPTITYKEYKYNVMDIKERNDKIWKIKFKTINNNIVDIDITQYLD